MGRVRPWLAAGGVVALVTPTAHAQTSGFWLVGYPPGSTDNTIRALSRDGSVAQGHGNGMPGFLNASFSWTQQGGRNDWGMGAGMPWNNVTVSTDDSGLIVTGMMSTGSLASQRPFRRVGDGPLENLGLLPGEERGRANGISGDGSIVVGYCEHGPFTYKAAQAFRWTPASGMQPLGKLTPLSSLSDARAISRDGSTIVGFNKNEVGWFQAFVWTEAGGMKALTTLNGGPSGAEANAVNADGSVIVGESDGPDGFARIARWKNGVIEDLSASIGAKSRAFAVSDDGNVVAGTINAGGSDAIVWTPSTQGISLSEYLAGFGVFEPADYKLEYVYAVSGDGRTFGGMARNLTTNDLEGFVAAIPGPGTGCLPDCDESGTLNIDDFICFQTFFALGDAKADCDKSSTLNIDDFICFQTFFSLGC